jgi:hypothetical protein
LKRRSKGIEKNEWSKKQGDFNSLCSWAFNGEKNGKTKQFEHGIRQETALVSIKDQSNCKIFLTNYGCSAVLDQLRFSRKSRDLHALIISTVEYSLVLVTAGPKNQKAAISSTATNRK